MKTMVIYYSYGGNTKRIAETVARKENAGLYEVKEVKKPGLLAAYVGGSFAAMRGKTRPVQPLRGNFKDVDRLIVMGPIWAGKPAPAFNALLEMLPEGKAVDVRMVSGSGQSKAKEQVEAALKAKNCASVSFQDVKAK